MALVKCLVCNEDCWESVSLNKGTYTKPLWFCSQDCFEMYADNHSRECEDEARKYAELDKSFEKIGEAIKKGEAESGISSDDAPDGLIMDWITKYS